MLDLSVQLSVHMDYGNLSKSIDNRKSCYLLGIQRYLFTSILQRLLADNCVRCIRRPASSILTGLETRVSMQILARHSHNT